MGTSFELLVVYSGDVWIGQSTKVCCALGTEKWIPTIIQMLRDGLQNYAMKVVHAKAQAIGEELLCEEVFHVDSPF